MISLRKASRPTTLATLALALLLGLATVAIGAPSLAIVGGPSGPTRDTTPVFQFEVDAGATVECSIDQGTADYGPCTGADQHTTAPLDDGAYTFRVRATDSTPEQTVATRSFSVDTTDPALSGVAGPTGPRNDSTPEFSFQAEAGATVECSIASGAAVWGPCTGAAAHAPGPLADGAYRFRVRATDAAGNDRLVELAPLTIDTVAPVAQIDSEPAAVSSDATPTFGFSSNEPAADLECRLDGVTFADCDSPKSYGPLTDGSHTFAVRAVDAAGNVGPEAARTFAIDTVAPTLTVLSGPDGPTNDDAPEFAFQAEGGATVECSVDQGTAAWAPCSGAGSHAPATLVDGSYSFRVRATDGAGNVTTRTRAFSVDTVAPTVTIDSTPLGTTNVTTPSFTFGANEGGVDFECRLGASTEFTACNSPRGYGPLADGTYLFEVRATDPAGNSSVDAEEFTIDLINPSLTIVEGPAGPTNDPEPEFEFIAEDGTTVECAANHGAVPAGAATWGPCDTTGSHAPGALADGTYVFRVKATDDAGHTTLREQAFTVDTVAPATSIASGPSGPTNNASPTFGLTSNEAGVSFDCSLDSTTLAPCAASKAYSSLAQGTHTFRVRARDAAGNLGTLVTNVFSVDTVAPTVAISFGPSGTTTDDSPLFEFAAAGATAIECSVDQGTPAWGPCTTGTVHVLTSRLANGAYTFRVRASDLAGNTATATRLFVVAATGGQPPVTTPNPPGPTPPAVVATPPRLMTPFPLVRLSGRLTGSGAKVQILTVRAPRGARVQVRVQPRCAKGARCRPKLGSGTIAAKGILRFKQLELAYRAGTTIEVRVSQVGTIGKYTRFTIRRGKGPKRLDRCLMPGATRGSACPAG